LGVGAAALAGVNARAHAGADQVRGGHGGNCTMRRNAYFVFRIDIRA